MKDQAHADVVEGEIKFRSIADQLYDYLSNAIIEGALKPGEKLVEDDLRNKFGISRSPIRECFRILQSEGLIVIEPRKGAYVKKLSQKEITDIFPVRANLEGLAAKLATPNMGDREIGKLEDLIEEMDSAIKHNEVKAFLKCNSIFHSTIIKAARNEILEKILVTLGKGFWLRIAYLYYQSSPALVFSNKMHKDIVKAFKKHAPKDAEQAIKEHIEHAKRAMMEFIDQRAE